MIGHKTEDRGQKLIWQAASLSHDMNPIIKQPLWFVVIGNPFIGRKATRRKNAKVLRPRIQVGKY